MPAMTCAFCEEREPTHVYDDERANTDGEVLSLFVCKPCGEKLPHAEARLSELEVEVIHGQPAI